MQGWVNFVLLHKMDPLLLRRGQNLQLGLLQKLKPLEPGAVPFLAICGEEQLAMAPVLGVGPKSVGGREVLEVGVAGSPTLLGKKSVILL